VATHLASQLVAIPYLVYWYDANAVQTDAGTWWDAYREQQATYLATPTMQGILQQAAGVFTLVDPPDEAREWAVAPAVNGVVPALGALPLPYAMIDVDPLENGRAYELGTSKAWRRRVISLEAIVRNTLEQDLLADALHTWFPERGSLAVTNRATGDGTTTVGTLEWVSVSVSLGTTWADATAVRHHVGLVAEAEFVV
jgi:hypothetical protein